MPISEGGISTDEISEIFDKDLERRKEKNNG